MHVGVKIKGSPFLPINLITVLISPSDLAPQALSPPNHNQLIKTPERSVISPPISDPPLSLLTILSSARVMKPNEPFAPPGSPPAPAIPRPNLARRWRDWCCFPVRQAGPTDRVHNRPPTTSEPPRRLDETQGDADTGWLRGNKLACPAQRGKRHLLAADPSGHRPGRRCRNRSPRRSPAGSSARWPGARFASHQSHPTCVCPRLP